MSTTAKPTSKKTNTRRNVSRDDIHRQQHESFPPPSSAPSILRVNCTADARPPLTPAEKAAKEARRAARAAKRAVEAAKEAEEAEEQSRTAKSESKPQQQQAKITTVKNTQKDTYLGETPLWELSNYDIYILSGIKLKEFVRDITEFSINNICDQHHTKQIEEGIRQITTLDNCFNVVVYSDGTIQILDGQHRRNALRALPDTELLRKEIVIHLYKSDRPDSEQTTQLFNRFNLVKPFKVIIEITTAIQQIITGLRVCAGFSDKAIRPTERETAHAPAMSIKQFSSCLEPLLGMLGPGNYTISDVVKYITEINQEYSVQFDKESADRLFKGETSKNIKKKEDMRRIQFYLNTELSKSEWLKRLHEKLRT